MFRSPEHCLRTAFTFTQLRIEPRNATAAIIESIRARAGAHAETDARAPTGMTQHDWHAQAAMALTFAQRVLSPHPLLWSVVLAEYSYDVPGALALQRISVEAVPEAEGRDRLIADALVCNMLRGRPSYRQIADAFDIDLSALSRRSRQMRPVVLGLRDRAIAELSGPMQEAGLTT